MPRAPLRLCSKPGCSRLTRKRYCGIHQSQMEAQYNRERGSAHERGYGRRWRKIRKAFLKDNPFCVSCGDVATEVDHIIPKTQGGKDEYDNLQSLCKSCHSSKTAKENNRWGGV